MEYEYDCNNQERVVYEQAHYSFWSCQTAIDGLIEVYGLEEAERKILSYIASLKLQSAKKKLEYVTQGKAENYVF